MVWTPKSCVSARVGTWLPRKGEAEAIEREFRSWIFSIRPRPAHRPGLHGQATDGLILRPGLASDADGVAPRTNSPRRQYQRGTSGAGSQDLP